MKKSAAALITVVRGLIAQLSELQFLVYTTNQLIFRCGGGTQNRFIVCLNYDKMPVPDWCDEAARPAEEQNCNVDPCPTCIDSDFG